MLPTRLTILAAIAVAATLTLAACGGDGDGGGSDDEADITEVIETSATTSDPAHCTELQTLAFTEQVEFESGEEAIAACEEDDETNAESVEVSNIEVDGEAATAEVSITGSGLDGQAIAVSLVKEDDQWKLDAFDEFVTFDKDAFVAAFVEELSADPEVPAEVVTCVDEQLGAAEDAAIEGAFLSGDENQLVGLFGDCFAGA